MEVLLRGVLPVLVVVRRAVLVLGAVVVPVLSACHSEPNVRSETNIESSGKVRYYSLNAGFRMSTVEIRISAGKC